MMKLGIKQTQKIVYKKCRYKGTAKTKRMKVRYKGRLEKERKKEIGQEARLSFSVNICHFRNQFFIRNVFSNLISFLAFFNMLKMF
jgi:hypothetical protein